jgi:hypothetical protein
VTIANAPLEGRDGEDFIGDLGVGSRNFGKSEILDYDGCRNGGELSSVAPTLSPIDGSFFDFALCIAEPALLHTVLQGQI